MNPNKGIFVSRCPKRGPGAAQNVANTSQKGSLLIFPLIAVERNGDTSDTLIEISNDQAAWVSVECYYVSAIM